MEFNEEFIPESKNLAEYMLNETHGESARYARMGRSSQEVLLEAIVARDVRFEEFRGIVFENTLRNAIAPHNGEKM